MLWGERWIMVLGARGHTMLLPQLNPANAVPLLCSPLMKLVTS